MDEQAVPAGLAVSGTDCGVPWAPSSSTGSGHLRGDLGKSASPFPFPRSGLSLLSPYPDLDSPEEMVRTPSGSLGEERTQLIRV